jgi:hypothetical protein
MQAQTVENAERIERFKATPWVLKSHGNKTKGGKKIC